MRVIIEETNDKSENKRRTIIECEEDNIPVPEAMDMLLRGLLGCGYSRDAVAYYFNEISKSYTEEPEEEKSTLLDDKEDNGEEMP